MHVSLSSWYCRPRCAPSVPSRDRGGERERGGGGVRGREGGREGGRVGRERERERERKVDRGGES